MRPSDATTRVSARVASLALVALLAFPAAAAAAPEIKPWMPAGMDSISAWAAQARTLFRANKGDSIGGSNYAAYQQVGRIGRQLLRSLGRGNLSQAHAAEAVIDSLGLDTEIAMDVQLPHFAVLMVRNPFNSQADVAGFLYWFVGSDLRYQGVRFTSGRGLAMRVWRSNNPDKPYSWGILENARNGSLPVQVSLMRMSANGLFWTADQYPGLGPNLGGRGDAAFVDMNNDGAPELVTWTRGTQDSVFTVCEECPTLITERTWAERARGFELVESRLVPTAFANFVAFTRYLREGNRAAAARLLANPDKVADAIANGWDRVGGRGAWRVTGVEREETWPHWIVVRHGRGDAAKSWVVNFVVRDGRWIIQDWVQQKLQAPQVRTR
jgi:hypothetical protein